MLYIGLVLLAVGYWQALRTGYLSPLISAICLPLGLILVLWNIWQQELYTTLLGYLFALFSVVVLAPLMGFIFTFVLLIPKSLAVRRFVSFFACGTETACAVYFTFVFCYWINIPFSPWMFLLPGVAVILNDLDRIHRAQKGYGPGAYVRQLAGAISYSVAVAEEARDEKAQAVADVAGLVFGNILVVFWL